VTAGPLRVVVADDHPLVREGLRAVLSTDPSVSLVAEAADGEQAVRAAVEHVPDVIVMDLQMPGLSGIEATRAIAERVPQVAVLVVTMHEDDDSLLAAMRAGARGYLLKGAGREDLLRALRAVAAGDAIFGPGIAQRVAARFSAGAGAAPLPAAFAELTQREHEVLALIAAGRSNTEIARTLVVAPKTVRNHISNIFAKLGVPDRAQAIVRAREAGLGR
jgi:DNA-binding NarL/FixJ family response regulator